MIMTAGTVPGSRLNRRSFLASVGLAGAGSALAGCSTGGPSAPVEQGGEIAAAVLPKYVPVDYAKPDVPSQNGSPPGYTKMPAELVRSVPEPPGTGITINAMTPLWGTIPPSSGNQYFEAVNAILGSKINFQISDGNTYGDKLAAVLASPKDVPDWVQVPSWNQPPRFGTEIVENVFTDLTPYLAGEAVTKYPNLANVPTDAWKTCVWNGKLYGVPFPGTPIGNANFYRDDLLEKLGITPDVKTVQDLYDLMVEINNPGGNQWATEDPWNIATMAYSVVSKWQLGDNGLVHRVETEEYRAALEWVAGVFKAGLVHPDAVAGKDDESKSRFQAGKALIMFDGFGGWHEALRDNLAGNPSYSQRPFDLISADESTKPLYWKGAGASMHSFIKKSDDPAKVEEILKLANVLAAPFGTTEFHLINYGVEGVHYTKGDQGLPEPTSLAAKELQPTYVFLADPPVAEFHMQYPGFVEEYCTWQHRAGELAAEPLFYGMNIAEPSQYASIGQPFEDLESDIARGRKPLSALDDAIKTWKAAGGDQLRSFYQEILDKQ
ncbi:substrate-binding domain-containing protein [Microlunatus parietis]|uniref:Putative aldouronate transport system substrate-binding protein n=2 Tax=Microlunatus parietis TaxID=682979 RepID=A0A7Y9ID76_9ACTN|nr:putative aldouronate transport system substrate-binding protein [Microlunatus parietis]